MSSLYMLEHHKEVIFIRFLLLLVTLLHFYHGKGNMTFEELKQCSVVPSWWTHRAFVKSVNIFLRNHINSNGFENLTQICKILQNRECFMRSLHNNVHVPYISYRVKISGMWICAKMYKIFWIFQISRQNEQCKAFSHIQIVLFVLLQISFAFSRIHFSTSKFAFFYMR